jgi:hypothetical protein
VDNFVIIYLHRTGLDKVSELVIGEQLDLLHDVFEGTLQTEAQSLVVRLSFEGDSVLKIRKNRIG